MEDNETRQEKQMRFIELRAKGNSLARCAEMLNVSKGTACNWSHELEYEIGRARAIEMEALMERFSMLKEARIEFLAGQLETIKSELETRGLNDVPTAKMLEAQLAYWKELMAEAIDARLPGPALGGLGTGTRTGTKLNAAKIEQAVLEIYERRRGGLITAQEAKEELSMLQSLRQTHEQTVLEEHLIRIENIMEDRKK